MKRTLSSLRPLWSRLLLLCFVFIIIDVVSITYPILPPQILPPPSGPWRIFAVIVAILILLFLMEQAPRAEQTEPIVLLPPVRGTWVAANSPGQLLPSHGTRTRGQYSAADACHPSTKSTPPLARWGLRGNAPQDYSCFGEPIYAMAGGVVVKVVGNQRDHRARSTWFGLMWLATFEGFLREFAGTARVLGNHVIIAHDDATYAAYAHIQHRSATVEQGQRVQAGEVIGRVGNTGNTSMPHLHVQLMDREKVDAAAGIPMVWSGITITGEIDPQVEKYAKEPQDTALAQMPRNGELFTSQAD